ncbi:PH, RCC1 and FYVE domains-containing protein 1-like isoform X2 [Andrographis paniculata]|uniref:PH, RCC1 and FYVE domains-containing protein 1-like isoform X2 n=1 Tax=Andrographis paniculata TaxID=175694 RepID=UPI0021E907B8|nr:PH, RCC1 and FYVE domains-containing protein 1-like isoform X2 [Andrographis paniculata]
MADLVSYGNADRDIEQDETSLIWVSGGKEKSLKLSLVSRIIPGQRTAVFKRYLRPEKEYLSFSLIYSNGKRSLDLICKDKVEAEYWITGLKALISLRQVERSKLDGLGDGGLYIDDKGELPSTSQSSSPVSFTQEVSSREVSISSNTFTSISSNTTASPISSHVALNQKNMQAKGSGTDAFRVSVSSAPSTSSHGSAPDDCDALGDVYMWGEVISDNVIKIGPNKNVSSINTRTDVLLPKPLECNVVMDAHHIGCGVRHAALVTRQGEVFTWGEESGGRLGHGVGKDASLPCLVESLAFCSVDFVACGEFHTCAVTMDGEIYTWGDGKHHAGLLGHGTDISHWIPKRISGPLEGLHVATVSCGPWHTALITSTGQLFTFGDGTFGVLGHGSRENVLYPREVESLSGLRTITVACGVWHTAAVVEVIVTQSSSSVSSGKLFTWGDGDKNRLGHGDKEPRLKPTCVPALIDYDFQKIACGHCLTLGLTTSGRVFTMGSTVYGQLGNPRSDGKIPCLVEDKLANESVEEVACGAYHVAVLTSKNEVYTWGKGANGRLGHGDTEDRKTPSLVEALKDRHVKFIACGSTYSSAICLHRWVSGAEQSQCSGCRQSFGFTRKRHNCYNCGLVHCHACSSKKAVMAALAPNPSKPHRVCDSCFVKLSKVAEAGANNKRNSGPRLSGENKDRLDKNDLRLAKSVMPSNYDPIKTAKQGKKADMFSLGRSSQLSLSQLRETVMATAFDGRRNVPKPIVTASSVGSRPVSPFSRKHSPPRSATPVPTASGLSFSATIADSLKKTNELLNREVSKLRLQVESLKKQSEQRELELQEAAKKTQEAVALAAEESSKCKAAKEVIKSLTAQVKDIAERLPPGAYDQESLKSLYLPNGIHHLCSIEESDRKSQPAAPMDSIDDTNQSSRSSSGALEPGLSNSAEPNDRPNPRVSNAGGNWTRNHSATPANAAHPDAEWVEQYVPGVYITLVTLGDGTRDLRRVRFSRRFFGEHQAETWWSENREKLYLRYNIRRSEKSSVSSRRSAGAMSPSSQV